MAKCKPTKPTTARAILRSHLIYNGYIDKYNNVINYGQVLVQHGKAKRMLMQNYGLEDRLWWVENNRLVFNDALLVAIDMFKGIKYKSPTNIKYGNYLSLLREAAERRNQSEESATLDESLFNIDGNLGDTVYSFYDSNKMAKYKKEQKRIVESEISKVKRQIREEIKRKGNPTKIKNLNLRLAKLREHLLSATTKSITKVLAELTNQSLSSEEIEWASIVENDFARVREIIQEAQQKDFTNIAEAEHILSFYSHVTDNYIKEVLASEGRLAISDRLRNTAKSLLNRDRGKKRFTNNILSDFLLEEVEGNTTIKEGMEEKYKDNATGLRAWQQLENWKKVAEDLSNQLDSARTDQTLVQIENHRNYIKQFKAGEIPGSAVSKLVELLNESYSGRKITQVDIDIFSKWLLDPTRSYNLNGAIDPVVPVIEQVYFLLLRDKISEHTAHSNKIKERLLEMDKEVRSAIASFGNKYQNRFGSGVSFDIFFEEGMTGLYTAGYVRPFAFEYYQWLNSIMSKLKENESSEELLRHVARVKRRASFFKAHMIPTEDMGSSLRMMVEELVVQRDEDGNIIGDLPYGLDEETLKSMAIDVFGDPEIAEEARRNYKDEIIRKYGKGVYDSLVKDANDRAEKFFNEYSSKEEVHRSGIEITGVRVSDERVAEIMTEWYKKNHPIVFLSKDGSQSPQASTLRFNTIMPKEDSSGNPTLLSEKYQDIQQHEVLLEYLEILTDEMEIAKSVLKIEVQEEMSENHIFTLQKAMQEALNDKNVPLLYSLSSQFRKLWDYLIAQVSYSPENVENMDPLEFGTDDYLKRYNVNPEYGNRIKPKVDILVKLYLAMATNLGTTITKKNLTKFKVHDLQRTGSSKLLMFLYNLTEGMNPEGKSESYITKRASNIPGGTAQDRRMYAINRLRSVTGAAPNSQTINLEKIFKYAATHQVVKTEGTNLTEYITHFSKLAALYSARTEVKPLIDEILYYMSTRLLDENGNKRKKTNKRIVGHYVRSVLNYNEMDKSPIAGIAQNIAGYLARITNTLGEKGQKIVERVENIHVLRQMLPAFALEYLHKPGKTFISVSGKILNSEEAKLSQEIKTLIGDLKKLKDKSDVTETDIKNIDSQINDLQNILETFGRPLSVGAAFSIAIMNFTRLRFLGWSWKAGARNLMEGQIANMYAAEAGDFFKTDDYIYALPILRGALLRTFTQIGTTIPNLIPGVNLQSGMLPDVIAGNAHKASRLMSRYSVLQDASNELQRSRTNTNLNRSALLLPYEITRRIEYLNQMPILVAVLRGTTIRGINGEVSNVWDAMDYNGNLKDQFRTEENIINWEFEDGAHNVRDARGNLVQRSEFQTVHAHIMKAIATIHGDYDNLRGQMASSTHMGRVMLMFRKWMPYVILHRIGGKQLDIEVISKLPLQKETLERDFNNYFGEVSRKRTKEILSRSGASRQRTAISKEYDMYAQAIEKIRQYYSDENGDMVGEYEYLSESAIEDAARNETTANPDELKRFVPEVVEFHLEKERKEIATMKAILKWIQQTDSAGNALHADADLGFSSNNEVNLASAIRQELALVVNNAKKHRLSYKGAFRSATGIVGALGLPLAGISFAFGMPLGAALASGALIGLGATSFSWAHRAGAGVKGNVATASLEENRTFNTETMIEGLKRAAHTSVTLMDYLLVKPFDYTLGAITGRPLLKRFGNSVRRGSPKKFAKFNYDYLVGETFTERDAANLRALSMMMSVQTHLYLAIVMLMIGLDDDDRDKNIHKRLKTFLINFMWGTAQHQSSYVDFTLKEPKNWWNHMPAIDTYLDLLEALGDKKASNLLPALFQDFMYSMKSVTEKNDSWLNDIKYRLAFLGIGKAGDKVWVPQNAPVMEIVDILDPKTQADIEKSKKRIEKNVKEYEKWLKSLAEKEKEKTQEQILNYHDVLIEQWFANTPLEIKIGIMRDIDALMSEKLKKEIKSGRKPLYEGLLYAIKNGNVSPDNYAELQEVYSTISYYEYVPTKEEYEAYYKEKHGEDYTKKNLNKDYKTYKVSAEKRRRELRDNLIERYEKDLNDKIKVMTSQLGMRPDETIILESDKEILKSRAEILERNYQQLIPVIQQGMAEAIEIYKNDPDAEIFTNYDMNDVIDNMYAKMIEGEDIADDGYPISPSGKAEYIIRTMTADDIELIPDGKFKDALYNYFETIMGYYISPEVMEVWKNKEGYSAKKMYEKVWKKEGVVGQFLSNDFEKAEAEALQRRYDKQYGAVPGIFSPGASEEMEQFKEQIKSN